MEKIVPRTAYDAKILFPRGADLSKLKVTKEGMSSITTHKLAREIAHYARKYYPKLIIDATANIGGNAIAFGQLFDHVIACEIKRATCDVLKSNISEYKLDGRVIPFLCDFNRVVKFLPIADIVFIDPPWFIGCDHNMSLSLVSKHHVWNLPIEETIFRIWHSMPDAVIMIKVPKKWRIHILPTNILKFKKMDILVFEPSI